MCGLRYGTCGFQALYQYSGQLKHMSNQVLDLARMLDIFQILLAVNYQTNIKKSSLIIQLMTK